MENQLTLYPFIVIFIFLLFNLFTFFLFYVDKRRAIKNKSRISERTLLVLSFIGGGIGAWIGMRWFRHKTQKLKFKIGLPIAAVTSTIVLASLLFNS